MAKRLDEALGKYLSERNTLLARSQPRRIKVYVEDRADIPFWSGVFDGIAPENLKIELSPPESDSLISGKTAVLKFQNLFNPYFIACVDADYDYISGRIEEPNSLLSPSPFIFHTYVHSPENFKCLKNILHTYAMEVTLSGKQKYDLESIVTAFSRCIYDYLAEFLFQYRDGNDKQSIFHEDLIPSELYEIGFNDSAFEAFYNRLQKKAKELKVHRKSKSRDTEFEEFLVELKPKGLLPELSYLFVRGHTILDQIVFGFLYKEVRTLYEDELKTIRNSVASEETKRNKENQYKNQTDTKFGTKGLKDRIHQIISLPHDYSSSEFYQRIIDDIQAFFDKHHK